MPDVRAPRLVKTAKPVAPTRAPTPVATPKLTHHKHRLQKLEKFEGWLGHSQEAWQRRAEVLPYFQAMLDSRRVVSQPVSEQRKRWLFSVDPYLASRELFRLAYRQRCASITWSPDDLA